MLTVPALDGFPLAVQVHAPAGAPRAAVIVFGGTAIPQKLYRRFAAHLADEGLWVATFDYRGIGASRPEGPLRDFDANMKDWALEDARGVIRWARQLHPELPLVGVGHSFGAQLIGLVDEFGQLDAMVSVAGQLGGTRHWPVAHRIPLRIMWHVVAPTLTRTLGYYPGIVGLNGVDLPAGVAREWAEWCRSPRYYVDHEPSAKARLAAFRVPTLMWSFGDDAYAPPAAVDAFERRLVSAPLSHVRMHAEDVGLRRIGHFGFFRTPMQPAWDQVVRFLDDAIGGRFVPRRPPLTPTVEEVMADLTFGWS
ncbi:MAG: alpha/beta fold hydrolase [Sandaracinaceae bacterium]